MFVTLFIVKRFYSKNVSTYVTPKKYFNDILHGLLGYIIYKRWAMQNGTVQL